MTKQNVIGYAKIGMGAGLVAGFALFSSFLSIDQQLNIPNGTFYKTIGIPLGLDGMDAIAFGFFAHMGAAALIGVAYSITASRWRTFQIVTVPKGILTGSITGIIVFAVFFMPIHYYVMIPAIQSEFIIMEESQLNLKELRALETLLIESNIVLWESLFLHVLFGVVMGLLCGMMLHTTYKKKPRIGGFL